MDIREPVRELKGVGAELAKKLAQLNINTISDLVYNYPRRYDDYSSIVTIAQLTPGLVSIRAVIKQVSGRFVRRGMHITEAIASDETGSVRLVWFNQPYRATHLKTGTSYYVSGEYALRHQRFSIQNPSVELADSFSISTARIVPIYRETKGIKSHQIRKLVRETVPLIEALPENLPKWLCSEQGLMPHAAAVRALHFPKSTEELQRAKRRLGFEEVFELSMAALLIKEEFAHAEALKIPFDETLARSFVKHLPFRLTDDQRKTVWQIYRDMERQVPMNRLIEGDVGSGKTVVATMAALMVMNQGLQVAFMAPTELLARQHADTIHKLLLPLGMADALSMLVGSLKPAQKTATQNKIASGEIRCIVGTHALIQEKVNMHKLGLVIIDEQHRFGVEQRKSLQAKAGHMPHVLHLTATPIPRSLALTLYGELDISVIETKPPGRKPIITEICSPNSQKAVYDKIRLELHKGRQMFVVCPLISESAVLAARSAEAVYQELKDGPFKEHTIGLLHGKMSAEQKDETMQAFLLGKLDILVATTVIEVGVDVPNATVMLIENAERFGLAQIHQLRGRVGRSSEQGYCYLMLGDSKPPSRRLLALESSDDGFKLAELDLEIRGPGAIYGTMQHGLLDLRVAKLTDTKLIAEARRAARAFMDKGEKLVKYKELARRVNELRAITNLN